jgi:hypothetical protein
MIIKFLIICCGLAVPVAAIGAAPVQDGMTVVRDAQTGKLRAPTSAELRALRASAIAPQVNMLPVPPTTSTLRPDGTRAIALGERGMVYAVMRRSADGTLAGHCVNSEQGALDAIDRQQESDHDLR